MLPPYIKNLIETNAGAAAPEVVNLLDREWMALQRRSLPYRAGPPRGEKTSSSEGSSPAYSPYSMEVIGGFNPNVISILTMQRMMQDGLVSFILDIRAMPIIRLFGDEPGSGWDVECETNRELEEVVRQALKRIMQRLVLESQTARAFGFYCGEKVFELITYDQLGVRAEAIAEPAEPGEPPPPTPQIDPQKQVWVYAKVKGNAPETIDKINRNPKTDQFEGYEQLVKGVRIPVPAAKAFVFTHRKLFGNLWGQPLLSKMYVPWWWLQFIWRALLRYCDRHGTPTVVAYAPVSTGEIIDSDGKKRHPLDFALQVAMDVQKSTAVALPADVEPPEMGGGAWKIEYLLDDQRDELFVNVLQQLVAWLMYAACVPEKVAGISSDQTGAYAAWRVPQELFMQVEEQDLAEFAQHVNDYLIPQLAAYNAGQEWAQKGKVRLTTKGLDQSFTEQLMELAAKALQAGHPDISILDLRQLFEDAGVPVKEEIEEEGAAATPEREVPGAQGAEAGEAEEQAEQEAAQATRAAPRRRGLRSMALDLDDVLLVLAGRQLRDQGKITMSAATFEEARQKASLLRDLGFSAETPIELVAG